MVTIKFVKRISDKGYPVKDKEYPYAHEKANKAEKSANPKMFKLEEKDEHKLKKGELMATHDRKGNIKIEKKFKKLKPNLIRHETKEFKTDPGKKR
jgi:hypothetical protein